MSYTAFSYNQVLLFVVILLGAQKNTGNGSAFTRSIEPVVLKYEIVRNEKVIGQMEAVKKEKGGLIEYQMESFVNISLVMQFSIYTKVVGVFHEGQLVSGSVLRRVNDNTQG